MRLNNYLTEKTLEKEEISKLIIRDCQPWIKAASNEIIYRGAKNKPEYYKGTVRKDRRPTDTAPELQTLFDEIIQKKFGFKPRSNGLFVTGDKQEAARYGSVYRITPIGKFKFLWSPTIKDFYSHYKRMIQNWIEEKILDKSGFDKYTEILGKKLTQANAVELPEIQNLIKSRILQEYTNKDLKSAIRSKKEIMIVCDRYFAVGK